LRVVRHLERRKLRGILSECRIGRAEVENALALREIQPTHYVSRLVNLILAAALDIQALDNLITAALLVGVRDEHDIQAEATNHLCPRNEPRLELAEPLQRECSTATELGIGVDDVDR